MLDAALVRDRLEEVRQRLNARGPALDPLLDQLATLDVERRRLIPVVEDLKRDRNHAGEEVARRKRLLKRLTATPMPRTAFLASFLFSRLGILVLEAGARRAVLACPLTQTCKIERLFDIEIEDDDFTTIAGLVTSEAGYIPKIGEKLSVYDLEVEILQADEKKIGLLRLRPSNPAKESIDKTAA